MTGSASTQATPTARYDEVATAYDDGYETPRRRLLDHVTLATVESLLTPGAHVLDAGAGTGRFAVEFLRRGHPVTLLDPSGGMLEVARTKVDALWPGGAGRPPAAFVVGGLDDLPLPDAAFDVVFSEGDPLSYCIDTLEAAAREVLRVLRPGGAFYVSCDNRWIHAAGLLTQGRVAEALACGETGASLDPYGVPVHAFGPGELRALFEAAGAEDVRVGGKGVLCNFLTDDALAALLEQEGDEARRFRALETSLALDPGVAGAGAALHVTGRRAA